MESNTAGNIDSLIDSEIRSLPVWNTALTCTIRCQYARNLRQIKPAFILNLAKDLIKKYNHRVYLQIW
jgi:hypothetical protein